MLRVLIQPRIDAGDSDAQIVTWLAQGVVNRRDITWEEFMRWSVGVGGIKKLRTGALAADASVADAAETALIVLMAGKGLQLSRDDTRAFLAPLVGATKPFTTGERDALLALSDVTVPRWSHPDNTPLLLPNNERLIVAPTVEHVAAARAA